jgi:hypothetical protein
MTYHIFIGYDDREHEAYLVAKYSLELNATVPIKVHKLHHKELRAAKLYNRPFKVTGLTGQYIDGVDARPFSTQFTFTRFLIAELWRENISIGKSDFVMFADCDFLFTQDIGEMFKEIEAVAEGNNRASPVYCVKHDYKPTNTTKMDNVEQMQYNMKLWAAMFVLDMAHPDNEELTPELVNTAGGRALMNFCWVEDLDTITGIDEKWQFIPNHSEHRADPATIHWTEGGPYFSWCRDDCGFSDLWFQYYKTLVGDKLANDKLEDLIDG